MSFKDILVFLEDTDASVWRLDVALSLAERFQGHLNGLAVAEVANIPDFLPGELVRRQQEAARRRNARIRERFERRLAGAAVGHGWREVDKTQARETVTDVVALHGRYCDLVVVGQVDRSTMDGTLPADFPGQLALMTGTPVLATPYAWRPTPVGRRVMVAWNASREAARAVNDALPLLRQAEQVKVLALTGEGGIGPHGDLPGSDLAVHLAHHGVAVEAEHSVVRDMDVGSALLSAAADFGADLLVMGAYGRARMRELVLGGVSREILRSMTLPVLMSH